MSDLVKRLNGMKKSTFPACDFSGLIDETTEEIQRLRSILSAHNTRCDEDCKNGVMGCAFGYDDVQKCEHCPRKRKIEE